MSSDLEQPPQVLVNPGAEIARLKRRLAASQEEVRELTQAKSKKQPCVAFSCNLTYCCIDLSAGQL